MDQEKVEHELSLEKLISGDRASVLALGIFGAEALKRDHVAVFRVDVLGRVHLVPPSLIQAGPPPKVSDEDLDLMVEEEAIKVMLAQGNSEDEIMGYLRGRKNREE